MKLELYFQLDRSRVAPGGTGSVQVRRYLIVANQTLVSPGLHDLIVERDSTGPAEFHILVSQQTAAASYASDPMGLSVAIPASGFDSSADYEEAEVRLETFKRDLTDLDGRVSGEVVLADPITAA